MKCLKAESGNEENIIGSSLLLYRYTDILVGNFEILQQFVRQGIDQSKIYDIFCKLDFNQLCNPESEVVKLRQGKATKNMGASIYSKKGLGMSDSIAK